MNQLQNFDKEDLLQYLLGKTPAKETEQIERALRDNAALYDEFTLLQKEIELYAGTHKINPPEGLYPRIVKEVRAYNSKFGVGKWTIASGFAILFLVFSSYFFWSEKNEIVASNEIFNQKIRSLEESVYASNEQLKDIRNRFILMNSPKTEVYTLTGNQLAQNLKTVAYVNKEKKLSFINIDHLPETDDNRCFQIWAQEGGEMTNLGILRQTESKMLPLPYHEESRGYYITLENHCGSEQPSLENSVAWVSF